jgi:competence protein ComEC
LPRWLRTPLAVSVCAQAATLPFTLSLAGGVPLLAPLWNLVAVPWLGVALLASFLWLAVAAASASLGGLLLTLLGGLAAPLGGLASLPPATAPAWPLALGAELDADPDAVELLMLDVGQGDAVLLRDGDRAVLVDGGGWPAGDLGGRLLLPVLRAAGVGRLRAVALTHPDRDHCGGLRDLVRYLPVDELWMAPGWGEDRCAGELMAAPGTRWRVLWRGERLRLGRWRVEVLHPPAPAGGGTTGPWCCGRRSAAGGCSSPATSRRRRSAGWSPGTATGSAPTS